MVYSIGQMDLLDALKNLFIRGIDTLSGRASDFLSRPKRSSAPLADRLLADAFRLGQIPSPTGREEERAGFVAERLRSLGLRYYVDEGGNISVILHPPPHSFERLEPVLLFTRLGSQRWNPLESLGKLDLQYAAGAGLADVLGPAALLSIAEGYAAGRYSWDRELLLYFSVLQFDDPGSDAFLSVTSRSGDRKPAAAIGIRGFSLGSLSSRSQGSYRVELSLSLEEGAEQEKEAPAGDNAIVSALISLAGTFEALVYDGGKAAGMRAYIRRIEALTAYGRTPVEGALELDLESSDKALLDKALERVNAGAEKMNGGGLRCAARLVSGIPPGDPSLTEGLRKKLLEVMRELKIKPEEEAGADPASFLSSAGIPALSVGIARGREGLSRDKVEIASIEKGRLLLEKLIARLAGQGGKP
ncbi:MAG: hypothetical protein LBQ44_03605 [Treponema sp.]|jgi:acetylornithine deacetylase/succinyl-diaminopimelate desuccinylase-like protein|nr:hypothetical protein [Treponema sp.]